MLSVAASSSGERAADLSALFRAHAAEVYGLVLGRCGDRVVAEEVLAQTFEAAARQLARGGEVSAGWLVTVARRRLVDHWRQRRRGGELASRLAMRTSDAEPPPHADPELWAALSSLSPRQRAVLVLRYVDDWSVAEVAEGLGISLRAAESLLVRARTSLRAAIEKGAVE